jgi:hypothetical protein
MTHTPDPRPAHRGAHQPRADRELPTDHRLPLDHALPLDDDLRLDGDSALDLLIANTGPGQTVLDFDHDPVLRAAAHTTGRTYRALTTPPRHAQPTPGVHDALADLVTLTWPRPHSPTPTAGDGALAAAAAALAPGGHVAILLEPTLPQPYTVTWTGALLTTACQVGLDHLQDVVCLRTAPDPAPRHGALLPSTTTGATRRSGHLRGQRHRVVLILRRQAGRHV